jgi:hypothetical protein
VTLSPPLWTGRVDRYLNSIGAKATHSMLHVHGDSHGDISP